MGALPSKIAHYYEGRRYFGVKVEMLLGSKSQDAKSYHAYYIVKPCLKDEGAGL